MVTKSLPILALVLILGCEHAAEKPVDRPNVILIMTDDQGYGDLACHGNPYIKTPHLDALYAESVRFTNFHVGTTCSPTRAALMTGKNCNRVGVWHTIAGRSQLSTDEMTLGDLFKHNGYQTAMFGKWHLGDSYPFQPWHRGFDEVLAHGGGGVGQGPDYWNNDYFDDTYFRNGHPEQAEGYCTDVWFDAAIDFMQKEKSEPFFMYLATNAPHGPFHVDSSYIRPYLSMDGVVNPNFLGMITNFDDNMGRLIERLKMLGMEDNTLLIYLTDNGTARGVSFDDDGRVTAGYNSGMRGIKGSQYEGGHRVPCFVKYPNGNLASGNDVHSLTAHVDIAPTLIEMLDLDVPVATKFDGRSFQPLLRGDASDDIWRKRILITDTQRREIPIKWHRSAVMKNSWRLIDGEELYDLHTDPGQMTDIAGEHPDLVSEMRSAYEDWWSELLPGFDSYTRAVIGAQEETILYSHDWHETETRTGEPNTSSDGAFMTPWHHRHLRAGQNINGYWTVEVEEAGTYKIELRRWPRESGTAIDATVPAKAAVPGGSSYPEGVALNINQARISIGAHNDQAPVNPDDESVTFEVDLKPGPYRLKTTLSGDDGTRLGAYCVYISVES